MPEYTYQCPLHGEFGVFLPMDVSHPQAVDCGKCGQRARRIYVSVPVHYLASSFTRAGKLDRMDERLKKEVEYSMDFDPTTGKGWEETEREEERKLAHYGELMRKEFELPAEGQST